MRRSVKFSRILDISRSSDRGFKASLNDTEDISDIWKGQTFFHFSFYIMDFDIFSIKHIYHILPIFRQSLMLFVWNTSCFLEERSTPSSLKCGLRDLNIWHNHVGRNFQEKGSIQTGSTLSRTFLVLVHLGNHERAGRMKSLFFSWSGFFACTENWKGKEARELYRPSLKEAVEDY